MAQNFAAEMGRAKKGEYKLPDGKIISLGEMCGFEILVRKREISLYRDIISTP